MSHCTNCGDESTPLYQAPNGPVCEHCNVPVTDEQVDAIAVARFGFAARDDDSTWGHLRALYTSEVPHAD